MAIARDAFVHRGARDILAAMTLAGAFGGLAAGQAGVMMTTLLGLLAIAAATGGGVQMLPVVVRRARRPSRRRGTP